MSNSVTEENEQLLLLDILGFPSEKLLFNPLSKNLIYSLGSNIISYNLITNSKTFVQYLSNEIILLKYLDESKKLLITIDNSAFPLLCIWELPSFNQIYSTNIIISSEKNFCLSNIFLEQIYQEIYLIIITSNLGNNFLFILKNQNELSNNYSLELFGKLIYIKDIIYGFKVFYNSKDIIFITEKNLLYYNLDLDKENCIEKMKIDFPFSLINNFLRINKDINIITFLTSKGNCLIYDQNGNNKPSINPIDQEYFTACEFEGYLICLGTNNGKIYVYNIYNNKPQFFIHYKAILRIKNNFQLNYLNKKENLNIQINDDKIDNFAPSVKFINMNKKENEIFLNFEDNSILLAPLNILIDNPNYQFSEYSEKGNFIFYAFNHSKNIDDIIINPSNEFENENSNNNDTFIFSCSKDQKIIKTFIDYETQKLSNSFFNLKEILNTNKSKGRIINKNFHNKSINKNINENMIYLTVLKYHPIYNNKLFAGDNKGFLYLFDINENKFQYKKPINGTYEIVFLEFSKDGQILCIGFDTGSLFFCDMRKDCEICLELNSHYMPVEESEFRKINNQIICFAYFFKNKNKYNNCLLYMKNNYLLEYCKLNYDRNKIEKKELKIIKVMNQILDIKVHISENYVIILNNTNHIIINNILSGIITAVIDLNSHVKNSNNIQIDESGLFLGVICELYNNKGNNSVNNVNINSNKKNYVIIFEIGTGKVKTFLNYINPISKIIFDNKGNFLVIAGQKGEISLWKLSESMSNTIKYVLEEMKLNINFWDDYEIKYDNNIDFKNEIINNSDYAINNRENKNGLKDKDNNYNQILMYDVNNKTYQQDLKNSLISNINYTNSNSNNTTNYFRRNNNESERKSEYNNVDSLRKRNNYINNSEKSYNIKNISSTKDKSRNFNIFNKNDSNNVKKAPLFIESKELLKDKKENYIEKDYKFNDPNDKDINNNDYYDNISKDIDNKELNYYNNYNNIQKDNNKNNSYINKDNNYNEDNNNDDNDNNNINDNNNDLNQNKNNLNYKERINNNINNNNIINKDENINGMLLKNDYSKRNNTQTKINKNKLNKNFLGNSNINTSSMKNLNLNTYTQRIPKINLVNKTITNSNLFYRTQSTIGNKNFNTIFSSKEKTDEEERKKNIKKAIDKLLENYSPKNDFEKEKNIQLTINTQKERRKNYFNQNNINDNNNKYENEINEDFIIINNKKINIKNDNNNNFNKINLIRQKIKKYPEPDNIDDNLISSIIESKPNLDRNNKIEIDVDVSKQYNNKYIEDI